MMLSVASLATAGRELQPLGPTRLAMDRAIAKDHRAVLGFSGRPSKRSNLELRVPRNGLDAGPWTSGGPPLE
eukprot:6205398-Alexandrium_andersonii.AAC.1